MAVDDDDEGVRRQAKRLRSDGPYPPPPPTDAEFELGEKIFEAITGEKRRSVPVRIAMDCIECTQFEKEKFRVYLNLTRGRDWGIRDGDMSIDMLIFALRAAAHTVNAKHKVWSTLDARTFLFELAQLIMILKPRPYSSWVHAGLPNSAFGRDGHDYRSTNLLPVGGFGTCHSNSPKTLGAL